ncbi:exodeoxyribonuclease VII large subunit [Oceanomicrobium pacificus]|uniref:Exodeoxyribonuclease 7 large subunit n=1 Tax=Oceanomicrobium pacificus TaxID=2692916 RepID=A0A6B0TWZ2_9RHOB|nr:exodeoxyribonuclease VII large subunit [Oceanomicrobium pacificus]MXU65543.1 exodeoxyribonuclease VII large subunit [Oceanomicrobium pacificus]
MSDLFDDPEPGSNTPEFTVTELSGQVKRTIEQGYGHVRVRGEVGRVSRPASGHLYFDLKDDRAVLAAVAWKGTASRLRTPPEAGLEVVATGKLTTFAGQSRYQMVVEDIAPAGAGALMAMLERRRKALEAEGLFDRARKQPLPFLPDVIGVVTSPSGAVIRDILHRLRDRFPRKVLIWPVPVQGEACAPAVAAAIRGFNALPEGGAVPRPDVIIVARGGGSVEDLWGFNEEEVVRAAADSRIPLISAVGHETDTTLIDFAADQRAPTPTAAAEMAVPVRLDLLSSLSALEDRRLRAMSRVLEGRGQRLRDLARALPRGEALLAAQSQTLDALAGRLPRALSGLAQRRRLQLTERGAGRLRPDLLANDLKRRGQEVHRLVRRMPAALARPMPERAARLDRASAALDRVVAERQRQGREALAGLDRMLRTLGYEATLARGFAVVRAGDTVVTTQAAAAKEAVLEIEFRDGRLPVRSDGGGGSGTPPPKKPSGGAATDSKPALSKPTGGGQGELF